MVKKIALQRRENLPILLTSNGKSTQAFTGVVSSSSIIERSSFRFHSSFERSDQTTRFCQPSSVYTKSTIISRTYQNLRSFRDNNRRPPYANSKET
jgi:hypothetical protein